MEHFLRTSFFTRKKIKSDFSDFLITNESGFSWIGNQLDILVAFAINEGFDDFDNFGSSVKNFHWLLITTNDSLVHLVCYPFDAIVCN